MYPRTARPAPMTLRHSCGSTAGPGTDVWTQRTCMRGPDPAMGGSHPAWDHPPSPKARLGLDPGWARGEKGEWVSEVPEGSGVHRERGEGAQGAAWGGSPPQRCKARTEAAARTHHPPSPPHAPYSSCPRARWRRDAGGSGGRAAGGPRGRSRPPGRSCSAPTSRRRPGRSWWSTGGGRGREGAADPPPPAHSPRSRRGAGCGLLSKTGSPPPPRGAGEDKSHPLRTAVPAGRGLR